MFKFFKTLLGAQAVRPPRTQPVVRKTRPVLDCLEDRTLMDAALTSSVPGIGVAPARTAPVIAASVEALNLADVGFSWGESQMLPTEQMRIDAIPVEQMRIDPITAAGITNGADVAMPDPEGDTDDRPPVPPIPLGGITSESNEGVPQAAAEYSDVPAFDFDKLVATAIEEEAFASLPGYGASGPLGWVIEKVGEAAAMWLYERITEPTDNGGGGGTEGAGPTGAGGAGGEGPTSDDSGDDDDDYPVPWEVLRDVNVPPETKVIVSQGMAS